MKKFIFTLVFALISVKSFAFTDNEAERFILSFYNNYVWSDSTKYLTNNPKLATKRVLQRLADAYEWDCDKEPCYYPRGELATGYQDVKSEHEQSSRIMSIKPRGKGWYRVSYKDMGHDGVTDVKLISEGNKIKLDDYKRVLPRF